MYLIRNCTHMNIIVPFWWKSTLVQVMTWCPQAASHYLSKCRPRSILTYGVTRPQWVNKLFIIFTTLFFLLFHTTVPSANMLFHSTTIFTLAYLLPLSFAHLPQQETQFKLAILYNKSIADAHPSFLLEEAILVRLKLMHWGAITFDTKLGM